jgi:hypothetical protein
MLDVFKDFWPHADEPALWGALKRVETMSVKADAQQV